MESRDEVRAVPGKGLEGDRYHDQTGTYSAKYTPAREVTFIESEAVAALPDASPADTRRNIVTVGVPLNHLVGVEFTAGTARFRGIKLCEPCMHLEEVSGKKIREDLVHRGGLNAQVLLEGIVRAGDAVEPV